MSTKLEDNNVYIHTRYDLCETATSKSTRTSESNELTKPPYIEIVQIEIVQAFWDYNIFTIQVSFLNWISL